MIGPGLTREEWRWLGLSALAATIGAIVQEAARYGVHELERVQGERREAARKAAEDSAAWRAHLEAK